MPSAHGASNVNVNVLLDALQANGILTILAEPNITAVTGQTASFLAGGEIPVPVPAGDGQIGIEYKQFGVSLQFTPTLLPNNRIALQVRPEVSSVSQDSVVSIAGLVVPSLRIRRADTTVEVGSGQTFAIAGLFQRQESQTLNKTPVVGDVPILGELFKSKRFQRNETELVILITPYLVSPTSERNMKTPLDSPCRRHYRAAQEGEARGQQQRIRLLCRVIVPVGQWRGRGPAWCWPSGLLFAAGGLQRFPSATLLPQLQLCVDARRPAGEGRARSQGLRHGRDPDAGAGRLPHPRYRRPAPLPAVRAAPTTSICSSWQRTKRHLLQGREMGPADGRSRGARREELPRSATARRAARRRNAANNGTGVE